MRLKYLNLWEDLVPLELRQALWRRTLALTGWALMLGAFGLAIALASWSSDDPSFDNATAAAAQNWLGGPGATLSDLLMQFFGFGSLAIILLTAGWGWRLAAGRPITRPLLRLMIMIVAMAVANGLLAALPAPESWPLAAGLGGVVGDAAYLVLSWPLDVVAAIFGPEIEAGFAALLIVGATAVVGHVAGLTLRRPQAIGSSHDGDDSSDDALSLWPAARLIGTWSWRALSAVLYVIRWLWGRVLAGRSEDGQSRLKIAMARANDGDIAWSESADYYVPPGGKKQPRSEPTEIDDAPAAIHSEFGGRAFAFVRGLFDFGGDTGAAHTTGRSEPRLFPEFDEDDPEEDEDPPVAAKRQRSPRKKTPENTDPVQGDDYQLPPLTLLNPPPERQPGDSTAPEILEANAGLLQGVLDDFGVRGEIINARPGPVVTLYELEPAPGVKSSRVISLADDIARSMSAISARVAVVPGRNAIGIELPNDRRESVFLHEVLASRPYDDPKHKLPLSLGKNIGGEPVVVDLARMPHLLIAGTTGSGKSVGINAMILSLLFRLNPEHCKLIMIDPKMLELSVYDGIPHLLAPVVTDPKKAVVALKWTVREMEQRYKNMSKLGVRNIDGYNARVREAIDSGEVLTRTVQTGFDRETGQAVYETEEMAHAPLPYIVVVVDEMADLMMVAGKDIEGAIQRLAQMARAAGIHIIMATQRPSVDVITGTIKANFPTRISFQVTSKIDSRTILGEQGAEQLLGQGDMLFMAGGGRIGRVHGAFVSDDEVESVVQFLKRQGVPEYLDAVTADNDEDGPFDQSAFSSANGGGDSESINLYDQAVAIVARDRKASTSYIQRRLSIGYNRAATIIERMEMEGVIGAANHAGKREILAPEPSFEE